MLRVNTSLGKIKTRVSWDSVRCKKILKVSNKFPPDVVLTAYAKVQDPVKGVNDVGLKASK